MSSLTETPKRGAVERRRLGSDSATKTRDVCGFCVAPSRLSLTCRHQAGLHRNIATGQGSCPSSVRRPSVASVTGQKLRHFSILRAECDRAVSVSASSSASEPAAEHEQAFSCFLAFFLAGGRLATGVLLVVCRWPVASRCVSVCDCLCVSEVHLHSNAQSFVRSSMTYIPHINI